MEVTKQHVVDVLRTAGLPEAAAEADRSLPERMELERAELDELFALLDESLGELEASV